MAAGPRPALVSLSVAPATIGVNGSTSHHCRVSQSGRLVHMRHHAFSDDALGDHDAVALAALLRSGEVSATEAVDAAIARATRIQPELAPVQFEA